ncbi:hypothetical protein BJ546DRAFT_1097454 [Cryomyces antarcticus]
MLSFAFPVHAAEVGYRRPTVQQRAAATTRSGRLSAKPRGEGKDISRGNEADGPFVNSSPVFSVVPAPLVLPGDDLSLAWLHSRDRDAVTSEKNVVCVAAPSDVVSEVGFLRSWSQPQHYGDESSIRRSIAKPNEQDVVDYLSAFYQGLSVKSLPPPHLCFTSWDSGASTALEANPTPKALSASPPPFIGLNTPTERVRIRTRSSPHSAFAGQLNFDDLLDTAISILPDDAYALLLLVKPDLYESADDEFVCGRAYGGSRVAVVSTARHDPSLDWEQDVEREHAWPASHCEAYVRACCAAEPQPSARTFTPLSLLAHTALPLPDPSSSSSSSSTALSNLWLARLCRTASHELGQCFGIEHCVYYASCMQGNATLAEDARQPRYLCPVDLAKVLSATGAREEKRYRALVGGLREVCWWEWRIVWGV